jgi:D-alanyl-D-alanine carboxypeptidase
VAVAAPLGLSRPGRSRRGTMSPMRLSSALLLLALGATPAPAQDTLPADLQAKVDAAVSDVLQRTGAPSAQVAVVKDGALACVRAYGTANLETGTPATPEMRYSIGSISKQFTAAAVLLLAEEGRLSLDDRLVRFFPELTRARDVSLRQVLSMTSGYQDFWPQDYVMPGMLQPVTPREILDRWARIPLDFEPGTRWQYSNTNYVIAGLVVEQVAGQPLLDFLRQRIFEPLGMRSVADTDAAGLGPGEPARYMRYALGPPRPAPKEGRGWMFAAGELAMTAADLARWDVSLIDQTVLRPSSYRDLETEVRLDDGVGTGYGLGVNVTMSDGRRVIGHGGEVSGFTARNNVYPEERAAAVVLTNLDATDASAQVATKIASLLFAPEGSEEALSQAKAVFASLQRGEIDRSLFTPNANAYFTDQALRDFASSLGPLGTPKEFSLAGQSLRGGMTLRRYRVVFKERTLRITTFSMPDGALEQFTVASQ